jgi:hypothetical protein
LCDWVTQENRPPVRFLMVKFDFFGFRMDNNLKEEVTLRRHWDV